MVNFCAPIETSAVAAPNPLNGIPVLSNLALVTLASANLAVVTLAFAILSVVTFASAILPVVTAAGLIVTTPVLLMVASPDNKTSVA